MMVWGLGVFVAAFTVRNILLRPRPRPEGTPVTAAMEPEERKPRQSIARYPNHVWSVDRTRVWRWHIWPTWVLAAIDHFSRKVVACCPLEGPNAGWVVDALEGAFLRQGAPRHVISDQEGVFVGEVFTSLLRDWNIKQRFGAVGRHGSIAVTERAILTLKQEWLRRVPLIRGLDHLGQSCEDFAEYYNRWRGHSTLGGAVPAMVHRGDRWQRRDRSAKALPGAIERRLYPDARVTAFRLAA